MGGIQFVAASAVKTIHRHNFKDATGNSAVKRNSLHTDHFCVEFGVFVVEVERVRSVQTAVYGMCICSHECMR